MTSNPTKERRREKRFEYSMDVTFQVRGNLISAKTKNISFRGFFLLSPEPLAIGSIANFHLEIPERGQLEISGRVVHVIAKPKDPWIGLGVEILRVAQGQESHFQAFRKLIEDQNSSR